jgi:hypothetical protein
MNASSRKRLQNERKFSHWESLSNGGRRYWEDVPGRHGWWARYVKTVDRNEQTIRFCQEIYNESDQLVEIHEKYPVDLGHQLLKRENDGSHTQNDS